MAVITPLILPLSLPMIMLVMGCAASPGQPGATDLEFALRDYDAGRFTEARELSRRVEGDATTTDLRIKAAYLVGLCDYRLGDDSSARVNLAAAAGSTVQPTAGKAQAVLGLTLIRQNRPVEAAQHFAEASRSMTGDDARQAAAHAAYAYELAGNMRASRSWRQAALRPARTPTHSPALFGGDVSGAFTLQAGAFRKRAHAERAADDATAIARAHDLGPVRIVPTRNDRGDTLYLVRLGSFESRSAATAARLRLGELRIIVVAAR